ncbi:EAL domain-containing protein [Ureibacillus manganicus]|uniref:Diguanylate cyclase n=1 Tax=Ureibacillus manganicus DSM 26584 TaxID=1384049 RepID=A0A0A3J0D6_9BACL|nr:EAL domain-containing protein [Ureibacillus manganicus]KGR80522.1 hypothetical protein CD29_01115 [Ureibacillus manganicus DSM 26584]
MPHKHQENVEQIYSEIIKLNPFDAVVLAKKINDSLLIEMMNAKALTLSTTIHSFEKEIPAKDFFHFIDLDQYERLFNRTEGEVEYFIHNENEQTYAICVQAIMIGEIPYFSIIIRQETNKATAKHLLFVEQYVDPIITIDLDGTVIYTNNAASEKLFEDNSSIIGQNVFKIIDDEYNMQFNILIKNTLKGFPMGMPKLVIKHEHFTQESFNIMTIPTYWNNQLIGIHIILKTINEFFIGDGSPYQLISYQDELTGLLNRKALNEQWNEEISTFKDGLNIALVLADLDRFKKYNESLGKNSSDLLLKMVSRRFAKLRNEFCEIYRYNGDEFVFILRYYSRDEIEALANKILQAFKDPFILDEQEYFITTSIGISLSTFGHNNDLESVLHQAEQAVYYAKQNGRFHYRFYRSEMSQAFPNEVLMEAHLKRAIEFNELSIHLQPQIDLHTKMIDSFEALIRWNNRKFGYVPPSQFISIAESSGLIIQIGDWVLEQVCKNLQQWKKKGYRPVRIAVNISPKQFKEENFALKIEHLLSKYNIEPKYLELEITESSMVNVNETHTILTKLKQLGVFVSVDDFGTGYSSLSYLKKYPIDIIKIDQSFIRDISKDEKNEAIIKAIITLSQNLGMDVVAEGVEEKLQEQFLKQHNCQKGQGYLYNKPLPVDQIIEEYLIN